MTSDVYKAGDNTFTTYYSNRAEGIQHSVSWEGIVEAVAYIPFTFTATRRA